jgi:hypothetical protein
MEVITMQTNTGTGTIGRDTSGRPVPDEADLGSARARTSARDGAVAGALNVVAGIWLIISPWVLGYGHGDAKWNPVVFGAIAAAIGLIRVIGGCASAPLGLVNAVIGVWIFVSGFWLATTNAAQWNSWILGAIVFVLGLVSASSMTQARRGR